MVKPLSPSGFPRNVNAFSWYAIKQANCSTRPIAPFHSNPVRQGARPTCTRIRHADCAKNPRAAAACNSRDFTGRRHPTSSCTARGPVVERAELRYVTGLVTLFESRGSGTWPAVALARSAG